VPRRKIWRKMPQLLAGVVLTDYNERHSVALPPWRSGRCDLAKNAVNGYEESWWDRGCGECRN
jgi:hypothetical protein